MGFQGRVRRDVTGWVDGRLAEANCWIRAICTSYNSASIKLCHDARMHQLLNCCHCCCCCCCFCSQWCCCKWHIYFFSFEAGIAESISSFKRKNWTYILCWLFCWIISYYKLCDVSPPYSTVAVVALHIEWLICCTIALAAVADAVALDWWWQLFIQLCQQQALGNRSAMRKGNRGQIPRLWLPQLIQNKHQILHIRQWITRNAKCLRQAQSASEKTMHIRFQNCI